MTEKQIRTLVGHQATKLAIIKYPHFEKLHKDIQECQEMSKLAGEPQCMSLTGLTGAGKTTLARYYAEAFPREITETHTRVPILFLTIPSPTTVKSTCAVMLDALGDPCAFKGTLSNTNHRLINFLNDCEVEIVILDEFHHLIDSETNQILEKVSEWLKYIIKKSGKPFLVVGIEGRVENVLRTNPQLSRLFPIREKVHPLDFEPKNDNEFVQFILHAEQGVAIQLTKGLPRIELLCRLHYATDGVVGHVMGLMRYAAMLAQDEGHELIELSDMSRAFERRIANVLIDKVNPFKESIGSEFEPSDHLAINRLSSDDEGVRYLAGRRTSVSDVLRAR